MASPYLIASLAKLRDEFNGIAPKRDKASDGWIGDPAHQESVSDHNPDETGNVPIRDADKDNEVHAIDVDVDLRTSGLSMEKVVQFLLARCRSGAENRLRYIIFNRRIWSASSAWAQKPYTGANPHDHHAHFSGSYESAKESSVKSWHLADLITEEDVALTDDDLNKVEARAKAGAEAAFKAQISTGGGSRDGALTTILARTGSVANVQLPALATAVAGLDISIDAGDLDALAAAITEEISDEFAETLLNKLQARLAS